MYYKIIENGYISVIGIGSGGTQITVDEYNDIMDTINHAPTPPEGYGLRLRADLTWEIYKLPEEININEEDI